MRKCAFCTHRATTEVELWEKKVPLCASCKKQMFSLEWKKYDSSPGTISPRQRKPL